MTNATLDADDVRSAARNRWREILPAVCSIDGGTLDGQHHACPGCGGHDRFSMIDAESGAVICRKCFSTGNGDGFAAVQHFRNVNFPDALKMVAAHLGITTNGVRRAGPVDAIEAVARQKHISAEALRAYAAKQTGPNEITLPMYGPDGYQCSEFRIKTDASKGLCAKGRPAGVFLPHDANGKVTLPKPGETWLIVEGAKDAAALWALGYLAIGLPSNKIGKKFARLLLTVNIVFVPDRDNAGNAGAASGAKLLYGVASSVRVGVLPIEFKETEGADVRDVLALKDGEQLLRQAIADAPLVEPGDDRDDAGGPDDIGLAKFLADKITVEHNFARDPGGKLYHFADDDGCYRPTGAKIVTREVKRLLNQLKMTDRWSSRVGDEVCAYILVDCPELWQRPPVEVVNVRNGLVDVASGKLKPHTPEHLSPIQLPVLFNPAAECHAWQTAIEQWFPADAHDLAWEIPGWLMTPNMSIQKAVLLVGEGANGKSRYLEGIKNFLGPENVSGLSLQKLETDRFAAARLVGKLANICPDLPGQHLETVSTFKALVGGDAITAEHKFCDSFDHRPFARLVFSANHLPGSKDGSHGFFRRWLVVPFDRTFAPGEQINQTAFDALLSHPDELSGLLNRAIEGLRRINRQDGLTIPASVVKAVEEFRATTDPLAVWLDQNTIDDSDATVSCGSLLAAFTDYTRENGIPTMSKTAFGSAVRRMRPRVEYKQRTIAMRVVWCYVGIGIRENGQSRDQLS